MSLKLNTPLESGIVLYLPFSEGVGKKVWDRSKYQNHGALVGAVGTADAGTDATQLVDAPLSAVDGIYVGQACYATSGAANGNFALISAYNGTTKTATFATALTGFTVGDTYALFPAWVNGKYGKALSFGTDDYVNITNSASLYPAHITVSVRVNSSDVTKNYGSIILSDVAAADYGWSLYFEQTTGKLHWAIDAVGGIANVISATTLVNNVWYHIAGTYDGSTAKLYINAILDGTPASTTGVINVRAYNIRIGCRTAGYPYAGVIDEVRVYNRSLSPEEIRTLYLAVR